MLTTVVLLIPICLLHNGFHCSLFLIFSLVHCFYLVDICIYTYKNKLQFVIFPGFLKQMIILFILILDSFPTSALKCIWCVCIYNILLLSLPQHLTHFVSYFVIIKFKIFSYFHWFLGSMGYLKHIAELQTIINLLALFFCLTSSLIPLCVFNYLRYADAFFMAQNMINLKISVAYSLAD